MRFGFIFDGIDESPHVAVQLTRTATGITMSLPWLDDYNEMHERWFMQGATWGDDPDGTKFQYQVPTSIVFVDPSGPIALVGCRAAGYNSNMVFGVGVGRASVQFAVLGARDAAAYDSINGLRSELEGLGTWVGLRSLSQERELDEQGKLSVATMRLDSPQPIVISHSPRLEIRPAYRYGPGEHPDETVIKERMLVQTSSRKPDDWWKHLDHHFALRDLVRLASWRRLNFLSHEAMRNDDPMRTLDGRSHGREWRTVATSLTGQVSEPSKLNHFDFTFHYGDVSKAGITRWLEFHRNEPRIVQPIMKLLDLEGASLETHLAQMGIGLEALGYWTALKTGVPKRVAKEEALEARLTRIVNDLRIDLPLNAAEYASTIATAYNSVKHANRNLPPSKTLYRAYRMGIQLFRVWAMDLLGVTPARANVLLARDQFTSLIAE